MGEGEGERESKDEGEGEGPPTQTPPSREHVPRSCIKRLMREIKDLDREPHSQVRTEMEGMLPPLARRPHVDDF